MYTHEKDVSGYWVVKRDGVPILKVLYEGEQMAQEVVVALIALTALQEQAKK
jgi:hypothetical protein